jgi:ABC-type sugar transport system ATPase subunit
MIALEKIGKRFGDNVVLKDITLTLERGEFSVLLGPSGSGKTLLLAIVAGLEAPTEGRVLIGGVDMTGVPPERRPVTMVFQRHALFPHLSVFENIAFSMRARHLPRRMVQERVGELLDLIGLAQYARVRPDVLSGGQCQRVAFARALAADAEVLLFDEPLNSLDADLKGSMVEELKRLHVLKPFTALYVTHDREEAAAFGGRVFCIEQGAVRVAQAAAGAAPCPALV